VDRFLYVAMSGAKETLRAQTANNHNLANSATTGFRADLAAFMSRAVTGPGFDSRAYATTSTVGWKEDSGAIVSTGRDLDVALNGPGWLAVQGPDGREAYTRAGDLRVDVAGQLTNGSGRVLIGDSGPMSIPPHDSMQIGGDGTVSIVPLGQSPATMVNIGRLKLVNPDPNAVERGTDGLFRMKDGTDAPADAAVSISSGAIESSNVNTADSMVTMIELSRRFDLQVKAMRAADDNARSATSLLKIG
jgi:flagellar basal-body rod protein FlgF